MLGRFIAQRRKERNLTQRELAEALHVTDKAVSKWERGAGCPDISLLEPLAEALGLSVDQLLTYQTAPAEPEAAEEPATSQAVQAVLGIAMYSFQVQGKLFISQRSTSPDGSITVVRFTSSGQQLKVTEPAGIQRRMGDGSTHDGMGEIFSAGTKITGLYWSPDSAYLAISQSVQGGSARLDCKVWHFYQGADDRWYGQVDGSMRLILAHLWYEGDEVLKDAFPNVETVPPSNYPTFDVTFDGWDGTVLQVKCTYTGTDNVDRAVTVRYDAATQQVLSAE